MTEKIDITLNVNGRDHAIRVEPRKTLVDAIRGCPNLRVLGLMTMPPWSEDPEAPRPYFRRLRELGRELGLPQLSMGMSIVCVLVLTGSLNLTAIVDAQHGGLLSWYWLPLLPVFVIYFVSGVAETNRAPFDFPEAEQELVAGYHTEYSSMSFGLFFLAEYINMVTVCAVATDLYLGGWWLPLVPESWGWVAFLLKISVLLFFYIWMRWSLPRYRYDQLMAFGWKVLLPVSVLNLIVTAAGVLYFGL